MDGDIYRYRSKYNWQASGFVIPLTFAGAFLLIFAVFLYVINHNSKVEQSKDVQIMAERIAKNIELRLNGNLDFLNLIAHERANGNVTEKTFQNHVAQYLTDHPEFINITWIDSNFVIKTVSPLKGNNHLIGLHIELPEPKRASRLAKEKQESIYTKPFKAIQANTSFEVWVPIFKKDKFIGLFAGVYSCEQILQLSAPEKLHSAVLSLTDENGIVLAEHPTTYLNKKDVSIFIPLSSPGNGMRVRVEMIKNQAFSWILRLLIGLSVALLIGFAYSLWKIKTEIQARIKIQETLKRNEIELKKQNKEFLSLNEELIASNNRIKNINQELLKAKERAEDNEILLRLSTELGNIAVWEHDFIEDTMTRSHNHDSLYGLEWQSNWVIETTLNATHPDDRELLKKNIQSAVSKGGQDQLSYDFRVIHPDQSIHWLAVTAQVVKRSAEGTGILVRGCLIDITYRKNYEIQLSEKNKELRISKEKAEESDRLKTAFLQNMSHEIRTPMNAIMGFSGLLKDQYCNKEKIQQFSEIINQRCNDLLDIINDILDIAKIESGQLSINLEECNLSDLFKELSLFFIEYRNKIGKQQISFNLHVRCNTIDTIIITDKVKLKQIFINLISNAFKFTEKGSIEGGCRLDENHNLIFYVSDTGIGIPADKQKEVFERFVQLNQGSRKNSGGTGLGLSIVKGLVNLLGGEIKLKSEPDKGSTFTFTISYKTVQQSNQNASTTDITNLNIVANKTILIVEDDVYNAEYLQEVLLGLNLNILIAQSGEEAIQISKEHTLDLILMDIRLPGIDGYEATSQIRALKPGTKIIAQTAYASFDERQKAIDMGCIDYISKPIKKELLLYIVNKHLS